MSLKRALDHPGPPRSRQRTDGHDSKRTQGTIAYPPTHVAPAHPPAFQQPTALLTFSFLPPTDDASPPSPPSPNPSLRTDTRTLTFTNAALRYLTPPPPRADLSHAYSEWVKRPETRTRLDAILQALGRVNVDFRPGVVAWRGVMTRVLTAPYEEAPREGDKEEWEVNVMCVDGTLYLEEHVDEEGLRRKEDMTPRHRLQSYFGYAFEAWCTSDVPPGLSTSSTAGPSISTASNHSLPARPSSHAAPALPPHLNAGLPQRPPPATSSAVVGHHTLPPRPQDSTQPPDSTPTETHVSQTQQPRPNPPPDTHTRSQVNTDSNPPADTPARSPTDTRTHAGFPVDTRTQWCALVKTRLGGERLVLAGEVDCVRDKFTGQPDTFVELKTSLVIRGPQDAARFEKKLLKFYFQSFLLGVPEIIVGFRTPAGALTTTQSFRTLQLPRIAREGSDTRNNTGGRGGNDRNGSRNGSRSGGGGTGEGAPWEPGVCLAWGEQALRFMRGFIERDQADSSHSPFPYSPFHHSASPSHSPQAQSHAQDARKSNEDARNPSEDPASRVYRASFTPRSGLRITRTNLEGEEEGRVGFLPRWFWEGRGKGGGGGGGEREGERGGEKGGGQSSVPDGWQI
ncbi:hypothetical protein PLICRDRAFT_45175 [Plicaturopsis crispa FD-325 SS-3]|uniref:Decapping nuclease n=1 Tax=Plicaturopsis crispa FD-325 SS-3 TaxID=944288 RepID=A0A0C9T9V8_PLICR|nr:hypothetical protein PLICRDRAFT_45175 [Plicaturopsis crispa FD-325 SS-3]